MLGQIANYSPVLSRNTIVRNSTSVKSVWQNVRLHYSSQATGGHFVNFASICLDPDEKPEDLYQRLVAFVEDNLLTVDGNISHHGERSTEDENLSATMENFIVLTWLDLLKSESRTLASIKREISQTLPSLFDEARGAGDAKVMRAAASHFRRLPRQPGTSSVRSGLNIQTRQ